MRGTIAAMCLVLWCAGAPVAAQPVAYDVVVDRDVRITMSDGIRLFADVHRPDAPGTFPVVLIQTPYNKTSQSPPAGLVENGYVFLAADVRGTGSSEGYWDFFSTREQLDGAELVEWAADAPWSSGSVGLYGESYRGMNQFFTAAQRPRGLKAIMPVVAPADIYRTAAMPGAQVSSLVAIQGLIAVLGLIPPAHLFDDPLAAAGVLANRPLALALSGLGTADIATGGDRGFDGPYHRSRSGYRMADRIDVPTFLAGGWYDIAQRDTPLMFEALQARGVPVKLLMGPWHHGNTGAGMSSPTFDELTLRWYDRWLKDVPDPELDALGPVLYRSLVDGVWRTADAWPPSGVRYEAFAVGTGDVVWQPASGACSASVRVAALGIPPATPCEDHRFNDATGAYWDLPVEAGTTLAGPVAARLSVSTTGTEAAITARLEDVAPDGTVTQLAAGWETLSFRAVDLSRSLVRDGHVVRPFHPSTRESLLPVEPGEVYEWHVELWPTAASVEPGHTLRFAVQPSDAARSVPVVPRAAALAGTVLTIHDGSEVLLPVM